MLNGIFAALALLTSPQASLTVSQPAAKVECRCDRCPVVAQFVPQLEKLSAALTLIDLVGADTAAESIKIPRDLEKVGVRSWQVRDALKELSRFNKRDLKPFLKKFKGEEKSDKPTETPAPKP